MVTHHSELLEVFPEFRLTTVMRDPTNKNFIGFAITPGSFLLDQKRRENPIREQIILQKKAFLLGLAPTISWASADILPQAILLEDKKKSF